MEVLLNLQAFLVFSSYSCFVSKLRFKLERALSPNCNHRISPVPIKTKSWEPASQPDQDQIVKSDPDR